MQKRGIPNFRWNRLPDFTLPSQSSLRYWAFTKPIELSLSDLASSQSCEIWLWCCLMVLTFDRCFDSTAGEKPVKYKCYEIMWAPLSRLRVFTIYVGETSHCLVNRTLQGSILVMIDARACPRKVTHFTLNTLQAKQNGCRFAADIFKLIFMNESISISIQISLKYLPKGQINNYPALVLIMTCRLIGDKPLSEPMMAEFTDAYIWTLVTARPSNFLQWFNFQRGHQDSSRCDDSQDGITLWNASSYCRIKPYCSSAIRYIGDISFSLS